MANLLQYAPRKILFTGCATGIGSVAVKQIARNIGPSGGLTLVDYNASKLEEIKKECHNIGDKNNNITGLAVDLTSSENARLAVRTAVERMGGLDMIFINHMGTNTGQGFVTFLQDDVVAKSFQLNVTSNIALVTEALPHLYRSGTMGTNPSRIVYTSSFSTFLRPPFVSVYGACKSAMGFFLTSLNQEMELTRKAAKHDRPAVEVSIIHFGSMTTEQYGHSEKELAYLSTKGQKLATQEEGGLYLAEMGIHGRLNEIGPHPLTRLLRFVRYLGLVAPGITAELTSKQAVVRDGHYDQLFDRLNNK
ncbi:hypothetical protein BJ742DRAFT_800050 [Cladochytrium replicatum]|nr:hypothetical protein BJ742DRAFT_800050 [Cladochytrium replicatum]